MGRAVLVQQIGPQPKRWAVHMQPKQPKRVSEQGFYEPRHSSIHMPNRKTSENFLDGLFIRVLHLSGSCFRRQMMAEILRYILCRFRVFACTRANS